MAPHGYSRFRSKGHAPERIPGHQARAPIVTRIHAREPLTRSGLLAARREVAANPREIAPGSVLARETEGEVGFAALARAPRCPRVEERAHAQAVVGRAGAWTGRGVAVAAAAAQLRRLNICR